MPSNDIMIVGSIITFFLLLGAVLPFVDAEFNTGVDLDTNDNGLPMGDDYRDGDGDVDSDTLSFWDFTRNTVTFVLTGGSFDSDDIENTVNSDQTSFLGVLKSIANVFFWNVSGLPLFINLFLWIVRLILYITIARNIWVGGGA